MKDDSPAISLPVRAGFLASQIGLGAAGTMLVWLWLRLPDTVYSHGSFLLPVLFGFALPGLVGWIPLTVASPFFSSIPARRVIAFIAAGAAILLAVGRQLAENIFYNDDDTMLTAGLGGLLHLIAIQFAALENGRHPHLFKQGGSAVLGSWIGGVALAGIFSFVVHPVAGLVFAALALVAGGTLTTNLPQSRQSRSPWLLAERSIGRFARLADLLRTESGARRHLLIFGSLFAVILTSLGWIPSTWRHFESFPGENSFQVVHFTIAAGSFLLGFGCGAVRFLSRKRKNLQPGHLLSISMTGSLVALILLAGDPVTAAPLCLLPGFTLGLMGRLCRESLLDSLDRKGARLPRETEAAVGTFLCLSLLVTGGVFAVLEKTITSEWPALLLLACSWGALAYFSWQIPGSEQGDTGGVQLRSWLPDIWVPGFAPAPDRTPAGDGRAVTILYDVPREKLDEFNEAIAAVGRVRRREGALQWRLASNLEKPGLLTESYVLESWSDYQEALRHESETDRAAKQHVFDLNDWESLPAEEHEMLEEV